MKKANYRLFLLRLVMITSFVSGFIEMGFSQVVIQRCDVTTGWGGSQSITIDNSNKKEGSGALSISAQAGISDWFRKSFTETYTGVSASGYLSFWLYVSDASKLDGGQIEISSSRKADSLESAWVLDKNSVSDGWNHMMLLLSDATPTNGGANLDSINFFRIYQNLSAPITVKLDFVRFTPSLAAPAWPVLEVGKVDNSSLDGKVMFGYQGWFNHPNDGANRGWIHWGTLYEPFKSHVDMYPDLREFGADEKYPTHYTFADGSMAPVFSSHNTNTVMRHMKWLRDYNLDGVFIQRFISSYDNKLDFAHKDTIAKYVMEGSEKYGRVFAIMYDGVGGREADMKEDWMHLVDDIGVTSSDRYLHHNGLPIVSLWGYTIRDEATVAGLEEMIDFFTNNPNPKYRAAVKLGVSSSWYDKSEWITSLKKVDVISPWFSGNTDYNRGQKWCDENEVDFLPVVHPGFSWYNLSINYEPRDAVLNQTPRNKGNLLWSEINECLGANVKSIYIAMFDEVDEGTAMFKLAENEGMLPREGSWVPLDIDGYDLPSDWYLRLASLTSNVVKGYEDNKNTLSLLPTPPEGIMTIRIQDEVNGGGDGFMEFIFPDFPNGTTLEISIDSGKTFSYSTPDNLGTYIISGLSEGIYQVFVRHDAGSQVVDMGTVKIFDTFQGLPLKANTPFPVDGATDVRTTAILGWTSGEHTVSNYIYFDTIPTTDSLGYQSASTFNPGELKPNKTYYWKINSGNATGITEGELWSFTTAGPGGPKNMVVLDYCDELGGWTSHNGVNLDSEEKQEGFAGLLSSGAGTVWFQKTFTEPINSFCNTSGYLDLWLYVSDVSVFTGGGQLEIGSAGKSDLDEMSWSVNTLGLVNGWNELHLPLSSSSIIGSPNLSAINWFRLYQFVTGPIETRIDFVRFSGLLTTPLDPPANFVGTPGNAMVALNWDDNTEGSLAGYNIYRSTTSGFSYTRLNSTTLTASEYLDENVTNGTTYFYVVKCVDTLDYESGETTEIDVMPRNTAKPAAPVNLIALPANGQVTLDWDDNTESDLIGYKIYRTNTPGENYWNITTVTKSTFTDKYLTNGKTYYYHVKAINDSKNESDASNEVEVVPNVTSIKDLDIIEGFTMFPNPASNLCKLTFKLKESSEVAVSIFDLSGRKLHQFIEAEHWMAGDHTINLPLNGFEKGIYLIHLEVNSDRLDKLLIVE